MRTQNVFWKHTVSCYLFSIYQTKRRKEWNNKKDARESARSSWVYSVGIPDTARALGDERENRDKKDNRGESKVKALGPS